MTTYSYDSHGNEYDLNGNRLTSTVNVNGSLTTAVYSTTHNELTGDGTYTYAYDKEGNLTAQTAKATGSVTYYSYDYRNRLTEVKVESSLGTVVNDEKFTYDVMNNRIGVSLNGTQQLWTAFDGKNPYIDFNGSGTLTERYLTDPRGHNQFYARVDASGTVNWYLTDNVGSIRNIVSSSGAVLDTLTYDPFGDLLSETNSANGDRFKYAGGEYDSIAGSYRFGERYYGPSDGRFDSQDPLGFGAGDGNLYRYVNNSPTNYVDPSGLEEIKAHNFWEDYMKRTLDSKDPLYNLYSRGCIGLAMIRLGATGDPASLTPQRFPGVKYFTDEDAAKSYREKAYKDLAEGKQIVIVAIQFYKPIPFLKKNADGNKEITDDMVNWSGFANFCTLHEPNGRDPFWEWMDHGFAGSKDPSKSTVKWKQSLPSRDRHGDFGSIYAVVPIRPTKYSPWSKWAKPSRASGD